MARRSWIVYGALLAIWVLLIGWQVGEHMRVKDAARKEVVDKANQISVMLRINMRAQGRYQRLSAEQLDLVLNNLCEQGGIRGALFYNVSNVLLASAHPEELSGPAKEQLLGGTPSDTVWDYMAQTVAFLDPVDLGTNVVLNPRRPPGAIPPNGAATNTSAITTNLVSGAGGNSAAAVTNFPIVSMAGTNAADNGSTNQNDGFRRGGGGGGRGGRGAGPTEEERRAFFERANVHNFILILPIHDMIAEIQRDMWLRVFVGLLGTIAVMGYWMAWGGQSKSSELQIRLVRQSELNSHLREMNLAAAGLAHETRNPLNIIRGVAHMISKQADASPEVRTKSREIIDETDRVAAQLNEFINYSRPREVRRVPVNLSSVVSEVVRALNHDFEEKHVQSVIEVDPLTIEADEQLLRQALFNLVLNSVQAAHEHGQIRVRARRFNGTQAVIDIADNGPGVAPENRPEIFKPYFTTRSKGTGLGLAVVQQIVLAHGWEIEYVPNQPVGALFRITHVKIAVKK